MSRADDQKRLTELEEELAGLLRIQAAQEDEQEPDKVIVSSISFAGDVARRLGIDSDKVLFATVKRLLRATVVPRSLQQGQPDSALSKLFDTAAFLDANHNHPLIRRMVTLPAEMSEAEEARLWKELRTEFPCEDLPHRHEESEIS